MGVMPLKMNLKIILTTSRYLIIAVALLHTSLAQTSVLQVTYNFNDSMPELVSLECLAIDHNVTQAGATYTFMDPQWREENRSVYAEGRSYEFTNYPTNESLITCTIGNVESKPVRVVGTSSIKGKVIIFWTLKKKTITICINHSNLKYFLS